MADALRPFALLLVLLNVVFVHSTGAVSPIWMIPLYALTLMSPWLVRYRHLLIFRGAWNAAVLTLFGILLHHATDRSIVYLLEDGLVLAVLCQVHLLNNSGPRQKPDLLFFNSFLIAFVTSFFCRDVVFSLVFAVYIAVLVPALAAWSMLRVSDGQDFSVRQILRRTWPLTTSVVLCTVLVFAFWPRDFRRVGWVDSSTYQYLTGGDLEYDQPLDPASARGVSATLGRIVAIVKPIGAAKEIDMAMRLRVSTKTTFGPEGWQSDKAVKSLFRLFDSSMPEALRIDWEADDGSWLRTAPLSETVEPGSSVGSLAYEVEYFGNRRSNVFVPLRATAVEPLSAVRLQALVDGTLTVAPDTEVSGSLRYRFRTERLARSARPGIVVDLPSRGSGTPPARLLRWYGSRRQRQGLEPALTEFLAEIPGDSRNAPAEFASRCAEHLSQTGTYALPGEIDPPSSMAEFLENREGHCEWFATALALAMRRAGIASRVVTGWLAVERDEKDNIVIRERHAHAWVEAWTGTHWIALDPTPPTRNEDAGPSMFAKFMDRLEELWASVTTFDDTRRRRLVAWMRDFPANAFSGGSESCVLLALFGSVLVFRRKHRRAMDHPAGQLQHAFRRAKVIRNPNETPREALTRAQDLDLPTDRLDALNLAVTQHETARYARSELS